MESKLKIQTHLELLKIIGYIQMYPDSKLNPWSPLFDLFNMKQTFYIFKNIIYVIDSNFNTKEIPLENFRKF